MGADGGSIPDRRDLVRTKGKAETTDKALLRELYLFCTLSKRLLSKPVVLDPIGKLYNKDALIEYFLDKSKYGDGDRICGHLKGVKDLLNLNLTDNPLYTPPASSTTAQTPPHAPFICPLSMKEMSGSVPFIALRPCGCVFSDASIRAVIPTLTRGAAAASPTTADDKPDEAKAVTTVEGQKDKKLVTCPNCTKEFDPTLSTSILPINPPKAVQDVLLENLLIARASAKSGKKRKAAAATDASTNTGETESKPKSKSARTDLPSDSVRSSASPAPTNGKSAAAPSSNSLHRSVQQKLAEQEQKRLAAQAGMSDAVKAMFKPKDKGADHHAGNADFFGRTFTRYA